MGTTAVLGGSNAQVIVSADEAALTRLWHKQNVQSLRVIAGDPRHNRAHADKSSMPPPQWFWPVRVKYLRAGHRQRRTTFMTCIRTFVKAYTILRQKLYACFSEHAFDQATRVLVSRVGTDLDIRVSTKTGRLSQVANRSIERHPKLSICHSETGATVACDKITALLTSPNQGGIQ